VVKANSKGKTRFSVKPDCQVAEVFLAGEFSDWQPMAIRRQRDGSFAISLSLPPGGYQYKFIVKEQWVCDPDTAAWSANPFGTMNSVARVS
jgi:1,4-alpha-glucan branching enzyme